MGGSISFTLTNGSNYPLEVNGYNQNDSVLATAYDKKTLNPGETKAISAFANYGNYDTIKFDAEVAYGTPRPNLVSCQWYWYKVCMRDNKEVAPEVMDFVPYALGSTLSVKRDTTIKLVYIETPKKKVDPGGAYYTGDR